MKVIEFYLIYSMTKYIIKFNLVKVLYQVVGFYAFIYRQDVGVPEIDCQSVNSFLRLKHYEDYEIHPFLSFARKRQR